jgi:hypothetical protein
VKNSKASAKTNNNKFTGVKPEPYYSELPEHVEPMSLESERGPEPAAAAEYFDPDTLVGCINLTLSRSSQLQLSEVSNLLKNTTNYTVLERCERLLPNHHNITTFLTGPL